MGKTPEELFAERTKRLDDATQLKIPDRVPVAPLDQGFFVKYAGQTWAEVMYDFEKAIAASKKTITELNFDAYFVPSIPSPGQVYDILNFKQLRWPGARLDANRVGNSTYQFVEPGTGYEAMPAEDYDWFLDDPTDYIIRRHWPRIAKGLEPLRNLPPMHNVVGYWQFGTLLRAFGSPEIGGAFETLIEAGREHLRLTQSMGPFIEEMTKLGFPPLGLAGGMAPYDYFADFLRGTQGSMVDMYRNPDKLKKAVQRVIPWVIQGGLDWARLSSALSKRVVIPLHKSAGGLMSNEQFKEFFWPSLRQVMIKIIDEGFTPYVYTEGIFTDRLPIIKDVPKGKVVYHIESDIFKAKEMLGDTACLAGGPPGPMMNLGSPEEVKDYCRKLIDVVGDGGGFIMDAELPLVTAKPENVKALVEFTQEYGVYK